MVPETKAAEDSRTPRRWRVFKRAHISARFWSAAVLCRFAELAIALKFSFVAHPEGMLENSPGFQGVLPKRRFRKMVQIGMADWR
jgi:hypothetical protein